MSSFLAWTQFFLYNTKLLRTLSENRPFFFLFDLLFVCSYQERRNFGFHFFKLKSKISQNFIQSFKTFQEAFTINIFKWLAVHSTGIDIRFFKEKFSDAKFEY